MKLLFTLLFSCYLLFNNLKAQIINPADLVSSWVACHCEDICEQEYSCDLLMELGSDTFDISINTEHNALIWGNGAGDYAIAGLEDFNSEEIEYVFTMAVQPFSL